MIYNFNLGIGWASSGVEYAQLYRARMLRGIDAPARFIFTDMFPQENIEHYTKKMGFKDKEILWFIPLSTKIDKYRTIIAKKEKKYSSCKTILIKRIAGREQAILIQNAFPTLEKYIQSRHTVDGKVVKIASAVEREIIDDFEYMLSLKASGLDLFFTDIDFIKNLMLDELKVLN